MRISDWSSDVCSSDLATDVAAEESESNQDANVQHNQDLCPDITQGGIRHRLRCESATSPEPPPASPCAAGFFCRRNAAGHASHANGQPPWPAEPPSVPTPRARRRFVVGSTPEAMSCTAWYGDVEGKE